MGEFHSAKSASGAPKWGACAGSIQLEAEMVAQGFVEARSEHADEGTAAHELGAMCLLSGRRADSFLGESIVVGEHAFEVTREMAVAVQEYLDAIAEVGADHRLVEERVSFDTWVPGNSGTLDHACFKGRTVWVDDYKHGAGVLVQAEGNDQLILYAAGLIETYDFAYEMEEFVLRIHQPRAGGRSEWRLTRAEVLAHAERLKAAAARCDDADAPVVPGKKQCQFCKAAPRCPGRLLELLAALTGACEVPALSLQDAQLLSPEALSRAMTYFEPARAYMKKAETYALGELQAGRPFPGWKLVAGDSRRKWKDEAATKADFESMGFKREDFIKELLIGVTDAEKLLPKVDRANFMLTHAVKSEGAAKLVQDSHPASAIQSVSDMLNDD